MGTSVNLEGTDMVFKNGRTAVAQAQPKDLDLCIGRPMAFHVEMTLPPPSADCTQASPNSARLRIGPFAFQSPKNEKDNSEALDFFPAKDNGM